MSAQHSVCRLCCNTVAEEDAEVINESVIEMLQTLLVRVDLTISENPIVCTTCRKKLEDHYSFKKKCVFIEDSITPFVAENVKINLKEIRSQIIKTEDMEDDENNVCRLCLQFVDNDMMLSDDEKEQFQQFFPEINLSRTSFVVLCSTCYDTLHKYFLFVTSCVELEQQLCNYSLDQTENKIDIADEKCSIKLENFQDFIKNVKEEEAEDEKEALLLNEELDIKCDTEEDDERYVGVNNVYETCSSYTNASNVANSERDQHPNDSKMANENTSRSEPHNSDKRFRCKECGFCSRKGLRLHILSKHTDPSTVTMHKCDLCNYETKMKKNLKRHQVRHMDPAKIVTYKCTQCDYQCKFKSSINRHVKFAHVKPSQLDMHKCEYCDRLFKHKYNLKKHTLTRHTQVVVHKCDKCEYYSLSHRTLKDHILTKHTDISEVDTFKCEHCPDEFKKNSHLRDHIMLKHTNERFKCTECSYECTRKTDLKNHILAKHTDDCDVELYKCDECNYATKIKKHLNRHIVIRHTDISLGFKHKCELCDYVTRLKSDLNRHLQIVHDDYSKANMFECKKCDYKCRRKSQLTKHSLKHPECAEPGTDTTL